MKPTVGLTAALLTPQESDSEEGYVVISDVSEETYSTSDGSPATPSTPSPLSRQDIAEVFAASSTQLMRESEAKAASKTAAAVATAVANVRFELEGRIGELHAEQVQMAEALARAERKAEQAAQHAAHLELKLGEVKDDCFHLCSETSQTLCEQERKLDATADQCYNLEHRVSMYPTQKESQQEVSTDLRLHREETNKRLTNLETRMLMLEATSGPINRALLRGSSSTQSRSGDTALRLVEQRLTDELRRKQDKLDVLSAQIKTERTRGDAMFVKVSAMSLVLRGGPLPTEDGKVLQRIASWLDRFKAKTSDPRLRERADGYLTKINEKLATAA